MSACQTFETVRRSKSGYETTVTVYECSGCDECAQKALCTRAQGNRQMRVSKAFIAHGKPLWRASPARKADACA